MNFNNKFKRIWWIAIISLTTILLVVNRLGFQLLVFGKENYEIVLFIIWICLLLVPLFSEIDLFGVKLKKDIEEVKTKMLELKAELINSNTFNPIINFHPSKDEDLEKKINLEKTKSTETNTENIEPINETETFLFQLRKTIEKELRRIFTNHSEFCTKEIRLESINSFLGNLRAKGVIEGKLFGAVKELVAISNLSIHGHSVTEKQVYFAKIFGPKVLKELKEIE